MLFKKLLPILITGLLTAHLAAQDDYDYTWTSSDSGGITYSWIDLTSNSSATSYSSSCDDCYYGPYDIGFTFEYYGNEYTTF